MSDQQEMSERRIRCPRHHWLFSVTPEGISIKCRAGECRTTYVIPKEQLERAWAELDKRPTHPNQE